MSRDNIAIVALLSTEKQEANVEYNSHGLLKAEDRLH